MSEKKPHPIWVNVVLLLSTIFLILFFWSVKYQIFYREHRSEILPDITEFAPLKEDELMQLGWASSNLDRMTTLYPFFNLQKPVGKTRVGLFGGSFVKGVFVKNGFDVSSQLQKLLGEGYEVINFGVGAYGLHQSYLLWTYLKNMYSLDYVIFLPLSFHKFRDMNMIHPMYVPKLLPPRAIFRIFEKKLKLIKVPGNGRKDAYEKAYSFFMNPVYIRNNFSLPPQIYSLLPSYLFKKYVPSIFGFNHVEREAELYETYRMIFEKIGNSKRTSAIFSSEANGSFFFENCLAAKKAASRLVCVEKNAFSLVNKKEFYKALDGHPNSLVTFILANQIKKQLWDFRGKFVNGIELRLEHLNFLDQKIKSVDFYLENQRFLSPIPITSNLYEFYLSKDDPKISNIENQILYFFKNKNQDAFLASTNKPLKGEGKIVFHYEYKGEKKSMDVGRAESNMLLIDGDPEQHITISMQTCQIVFNLPYIEFREWCRDDIKMSVSIGEDILFDTIPTTRYRNGHASRMLSHPDWKWYAARSREDDGIDISTLPNKGQFFAKGTFESGEVFQLKMGSYEFEWEQ